MRLTSARSIRLAAVLVPTTVASLLSACSDATAPTEVRSTEPSVSQLRRSLNSGGDSTCAQRNSDGSCRSGVVMPWY